MSPVRLLDAATPLLFISLFSVSSCRDINDGSTASESTLTGITCAKPVPAGYVLGPCRPGTAGSKLEVCTCYPLKTVTGTVRPSFYVTHVVYAVPAKGSSVAYSSGQTLGSTTSVKNSFSDSSTITGKLAGKNADYASGSYSVAVNETTDTSSSWMADVSVEVSAETKKPGLTDVVDHGDDEIWMLLSPVLNMTIVVDEFHGTKDVKWTFEFDSRTRLEMAYVRELKSPSTLPGFNPGLYNALTGAGVTPDQYPEILKTDPFANGETTIDPDRFELAQNVGLVGGQMVYSDLHVSYNKAGHPGDMPTTQTFIVTRKDTTTTSHDSTVSSSTTVEESGGPEFIKVFSQTLTNQSKMTWTYSVGKKQTTGTTVKDTVIIAQPSSDYHRPEGFIDVYVDKIYKTYLFAPSCGGAPCPTSNRKDFNLDAQTDILLHNPDTGAVQAWLMNGTVRNSSADINMKLLGSDGWAIKGTGDFNGDGQTDIVGYQGATGTVRVFLMDGTTFTSSKDVSRNGEVLAVPADTGWDIKGTGDFNGDGQIDLLWHHAVSGEIGVWFLNGTTFVGNEDISWNTSESSGWRIKGTGDFDGDGQVDILWHNGDSGLLSVWLLHRTTVFQSPLISWSLADSAGWQLKGTGDFNGDGKVDLVWHNSSSGQASTWLLDGVTVIGSPLFSTLVPPGSAWQIVTR
ncbi:MAG TPA: VCBS repeat-containing protein [Polyangia bacterium]|nr:VCBS repeat-containing protein [Polyangia bacterium]